MRSSLRDLLNQLVQRGWAKLDVQPGVPRPAPPGPWWTIDLGTDVTTVTLHPWREGLLEFTITVLADDDNVIQSFELECNAMPVPVALADTTGSGGSTGSTGSSDSSDSESSASQVSPEIRARGLIL